MKFYLRYETLTTEICKEDGINKRFEQVYLARIKDKTIHQEAALQVS